MHADRTRRAFLAGAGAAGLTLSAGCTVYGGEAESAPEPAAETPPTGAGSTPQAKGGKEIGQAADIPVGGGKIFADEKVVVTQPAAGTFKAFSTVCTHAGCAVENVSGGTINCPCHGSTFRVTDGSVASGPARKPLPPKAISVVDGTIRLP
ncbi:Rieske (2Fe-2S) protein [Phytohabitans sp. LJ34]|uniref:Rieske (2Fe-2S) protein n=1 Tax=Phytohabitans sp. LJ34 TaxID=3452217 RepID=UPI003F8999E3